MNLLDLGWLFLAWLVSVAFILRWNYHLHRWPEPGEELPPRDQPLDLTGRRLGR